MVPGLVTGMLGSDQPPAVEPEEVPTGRVARMKKRQAALKARYEAMQARAEAERSRRGSVDAVFEMAERDSEVGGGIIAGALAYRLFIWLLPLALVTVVGLGYVADASGDSPEEAANRVGLAGLVTQSVSSASKSANRWYALVVGIPILLYLTRSLLRVLIGVHRLVWGDLRASAPKPTIVSTLKLLAVLVGFFVVAGLGTTVRHHSLLLGILAVIVIALPYAGLWLYVTVKLPHREATWKDLVPGAVLFGISMEGLQAFAVYFLGPYSLSKEGTYGALGIAAVLLFALYLLSRVVVFAAVVNATLWSRRTGSPGSS
jgi:membrane protein